MEPTQLCTHWWHGYATCHSFLLELKYMPTPIGEHCVSLKGSASRSKLVFWIHALYICTLVSYTQSMKQFVLKVHVLYQKHSMTQSHQWCGQLLHCAKLGREFCPAALTVYSNCECQCVCVHAHVEWRGEEGVVTTACVWIYAWLESTILKSIIDLIGNNVISQMDGEWLPL